MKVLLGVDDSAFSQAAVEAVAHRPWPAGTVIKVVSAVEDDFFLGHEERNPYESAQRAVDHALTILQAQNQSFELTGEIIEGSPKQVLLDEAEAWGADLIVVGSHGRRGLDRFLLGSVSHAVALHAPCSVEIVRRTER